MQNVNSSHIKLIEEILNLLIITELIWYLISNKILIIYQAQRDSTLSIDVTRNYIFNLLPVYIRINL